MKSILIKNLHWLIIAYAGNNLYNLYIEKTERLTGLTQAIPSIESKIKREARKLKRIEEFKKNLEVTKKRVREVVAEIEKAQKQLPEDVNEAVVQEYLSDLTTKLKFKSVEQQPLQEKKATFYFAKEYEVKGIGTYLQGLILLENIEKSERILNVKGYEITYAKIRNRSRFPVLDMKLTLESFRYDKNHKEKSGVEEIEKKFNRR